MINLSKYQNCGVVETIEHKRTIKNGEEYELKLKDVPKLLLVKIVRDQTGKFIPSQSYDIYEKEVGPYSSSNEQDTEEEAMDVIFGYMILNDVSARDIQEMDKQFTRAKSFDTFAPCGPWITTKDEINDPQNLKLLTKVNGTIRQDSTTSNMFIKIPSIISILSKSMTLEPGDIISTGTSAGIALNNPNIPYLKEGDVIEMEIEKLGSIKNIVRFVD